MASRRRQRLARIMAMIAGSGVLVLTSATGAGASTVYTAQIIGSGSSWAANAVDIWIANISNQGVQVVFTPDGSAAGRQDFALGTTDFGVSDIGYQGYNSVTGTNDSSNRPYAYLPITAGGTSFPYNIVVAGKRITNLRLSGKTLAEIFTNQITNWDAPQITADNNGRQLPSLPIITVVPSEGSGTTAMFTQYLSYEYPSIWGPFNYGDTGFTEYWPRQGSNQVAQDGSSQVMNYVASPAANGAIGIDEYSYPLAAGFPVAQIENAAGYYVLPTEYNDAVALTQAQINMDTSSPDYLLQNLDNVYGYTDPRTYPLSSYSYTIMPTSKTDQRMEPSPGQFPAKWQALADFLYYSICQGQEYIGPVGYSALPVNLVEAGFQQIEKIKAAAPSVDLNEQNVDTCNNPTFTYGHPGTNHLAQIAPYPPQCDKTGYGPCTGILNGNANGGQGSTSPKSGSSPSPGPSSGTGSHGSSPAPGSGSSRSPSSGGGGSGSPGGSGTTSGGSTGSGGSSATGSTGSGVATASLSNVPAGLDTSLSGALSFVAIVLFVLALVLPPVLVMAWTRARRRW
jgi:phosphate transport system substrate-binding protein